MYAIYAIHAASVMLDKPRLHFIELMVGTERAVKTRIATLNALAAQNNSEYLFVYWKML